ncbi:hypothetical protein [Sulfurimonas sp.]|uniref:hypothetical protein n=1 Tax=Sulfurimonas sp. TaxID=2022749 RepID=UPI0025EB4955|nr:hypothetical protein [Sulfurimonas sp.]MBW6489456.1 hypothetical protein [Sulfurimonas sp.]
MYRAILVIFVYFFTGCTSPKEPNISQAEELPSWVNNPPELHAVGSSGVNFQGIYTQHLEAINKAKGDLAHNIKSYITSEFEMESKSTKKSSSTKVYDKVNAFSELFLNESYQVDAYIDSKKRLYVLMGSSKERISNLLGIKAQNSSNIALTALKTEPFLKEILMQSRCYSKDILKGIDTESRLYQNKPVWFFRPNYNGVVGSVGIAEKEEGVTFLKQKSAAFALAKSALAKRVQSQIASEHEALKITYNDTSGKIFESSLIIRSEMRLDGVVQRDLWLDPKSCELYIWAVKK